MNKEFRVGDWVKTVYYGHVSKSVYQVVGVFDKSCRIVPEGSRKEGWYSHPKKNLYRLPENDEEYKQIVKLMEWF